MITVRLQVLNGVWETVGSGRTRGIVAEGFQGAGDDKGPDTCTFSLRRLRGGGNFPDLSSFTPCEVERNGKIIWDGRVKGTPARDGDDMAISVTGEGWQHHLDDDVYGKVYVHSKLADWRDARSFSDANLTNYHAPPTITTGGGSIAMIWPNGSAVVLNQSAEAVYLDLGPDSTAKRVVVTFVNAGITGLGQFGLQILGGTSVAAAASNAAVTVDAFTSATTAGTFTTPVRFVGIHVFRSGGSATITSDEGVQITAIQVFASTAYESGNVSILKATDIVDDALLKAPLLSSDVTGVQGSTFSNPDFAPTGARTPRENIEAANALEAWQYKIDLNRRPIYRPWPGSGVSQPLGPLNTTTGADDTSIGTAAWTNPGNIAASDNVYATVALGNTVTSHYLKGTNCGFSQIPADAIITGIQLEVERSSSVNAAVAWQSVKIVKNGVVGGDEQIVTLQLGWGTSDVIDTFGGPGNLWGLTWTGADIRASNFGAAVSASTGVITGTAQIDMMRITVYFKPSDTFAAAGTWPGVVFEDASLNDGSEIYNKVRVEYTAQDGSPSVVTRTAAQQPAGLTSLVAIASPSFLNPSFSVDAANWTVTAGTLTRSTTAGEFDSSPGGGKWVTVGGNAGLNTTLSGTFKAGVTYLVQSRVKGTAGAGILIGLQDSGGLGPIYFQQTITGTGSFNTITFSWTPGFDTTSVEFSLFTNLATTTFVDTCSISKATPTLPDKRGFNHTIILPVGAALTTAAANQVGDLFLQQHATTPLKGTVTVMPGGLRRMPGGATVESAELIRRGGELIRFMNLIHPDTGGVGRDGRIMAVTYDEPTDTATVTIDNERRNFDALLARLAILAPPS